MNEYKSKDGCTDENCMTCSLVEEFSLMIKDDVHWENALRHILDVAFTKDDELMSDILDESYGIGFHDGIMFGIEQSQKALDNVHEFMANKIAEDESNDSEIEEEDDVIIFKGEDDTDDDIQKIIKRNQ